MTAAGAPRRAPFRLVAVAAVVALAVAGAATSATAGLRDPGSLRPPLRPTPTRDPCSLVTQGEAEAVLGQPIDPPNTSLGRRICRYQAVSKHQLMLVTVSRFRRPIQDVFRRQRATRRFFDHDVPALGRLAYCSKRQGLLVTVYVVRGDVELQFVADTCRRAEALASIGVRRV